MEGGCACGAVRYRIEAPPLIVHCCHCHACQREVGSAFAVNIVIEVAKVTVVRGETEAFPVPTESGNPHAYHRCTLCRGSVWHVYDPPGAAVRFVPAGTLDAGHGIEPDIHIFTESKQPWVPVPDGVRTEMRFYSYRDVWRPDSLARLKAATASAGDT